MALKFRRGTTAQKSGSLAFGEPYVNTTLGTLQIGLESGDATLTALGTGSSIAVAGISGSSLDITGNAKIDGNLILGGNITIGDSTTDNIVINADLSSSLIPNDDNAFDVGSISKKYRAIYGGSISGSVVEINSGSNTELRFINRTTGIEYHLQNGDSGNFQVHNGTTGKLLFRFNSGSVADGNQDAQFFGGLEVSESLQAHTIFGTHIGALESFSASVITGIGNVTAYSSSVASKFITLGTYTASVDSRFTTLATLTGSNSIRLTNLETFSGSQLTKDSTLATYTASVDGRFTTLATLTGSNSIRLTNLESTTASLNISVSNLNTVTASALTRLTALEVDTANLETFSGSQLTKNSTLATYTGSNDTKWSTLGSLSGSFARTNSTNTFSGDQTITGSLYVSANLIVQGSSSIQNISSSTLNIGTNIITVAVNQPSVRFGGIAVIDSGSAGASGSFLYDSLQDEFIFVHKGNGTNVTSSHFVLGPETYDNLGTETYLTNNRLPKGTGKEHLVDSQISDDGTTVSIGGALTVTGNITGPIRATNGVVSGSSQITYASISSIPAGIVSGSSQLTSILPAGVISGSSQVVGSSITTNTITIGSTSTALGGTSTTLAGLTSVSSTGFTGALTGNASTATTLQTARNINGTSFNGSADITIPNLVSGSAQITAGSTTNFATDVKTQLNSNTVVSSSVQIDLTATSNYIGGILTRLNAVGVVSGSKTISGITLGSNLATLTIGTGLSGTSYNGSTAVTIANTGVTSITSNTGLSSNVSATGAVTITNTGVTSNVAGSGISVSGATGAVTITNSGVRSIAAGTGIAVSATTGDSCSISIGQAVATSSNVQFNSLGIGMAASATAGRIDATNDIVAYSSSDIRFKENIKPIDNAIDKIRKISGNTYDWKAENKVEHGYEGNDVGVIAQEVEAVLPQLVQTRESGYKAVKYDKLVALLIEGIKEQQLQIEQLRIDLDNCRNKGL